jgi:hypothetical protein
MRTRFDLNGAVKTVGAYGGTDTESYVDGKLTSDGLYSIFSTNSAFTIGSETLYGGNAKIITKHTLDGALSWVQVLRGIYSDIYSFQVVDSGMLFIWGHADGLIGNNTEIVPTGKTTVKLNTTDGSVEWLRVLDDVGSYVLVVSDDRQSLFQLIQLDSDGLKINEHVTIPGKKNQNAVLLKISNSNGEIEWYKTIIGSSSDTSGNTINIQNDNIYISGDTRAATLQFGSAQRYVTTSAALFLAVVSNITDMCKDGTEQCDICQDEATCHSCVSGYLISNATNELKCVSIADSCKTTITVCDTCSSETKCIKCNIGYTLKNNNCESISCEVTLWELHHLVHAFLCLLNHGETLILL